MLSTSVEPEVGLCLTALRSGPEPKPRVSCTTDRATQELQYGVIKSRTLRLLAKGDCKVVAS